MKTGVAVLALAAALAAAGPAARAGASIETAHLVVSDASGKLGDAQLEDLAGRAQGALGRVLAFWSADPGMAQYGRIRVVFDEPRKRVYYASVFHWQQEYGRRVRAVRVFGYEAPPQEMVHKLTSAVFPQADKLIRNMMGVAVEERIGNRLSFPGCGFDVDDWVLAFLEARPLIALADLGPDHESWGMRIGRDGFPYVFDRLRQTMSYAQAGSFGNHLIDTYGTGKLKELHALASPRGRPWQEVFGATLAELEARWLQALQARRTERLQNARRLSGLFEANPNMACLNAHKLAAGGSKRFD